MASGRPHAPYENMYIGLFVYTLGVLAGRDEAGAADLTVPTVLQQTPLDSSLADVLSGWKGRQVLIEFKRFERGIADEAVSKAQKVKAVLRLRRRYQQRDPQAIPVPDRAHWLGFGTPSTELPNLWFRPYSTVAPAPGNQSRRRPAPTQYRLADFLERLRREEPDVGVTDLIMQRYLNELASAQGANGDGDINGFLITVMPKGQIGVIRYEGNDHLALQFDGVADAAHARVQPEQHPAVAGPEADSVLSSNDASPASRRPRPRRR